MKKRNFLTAVLVAALSLVAVSCGEPSEKDGFYSMDLNAENTFTITDYQEHDPEAGYPMTLSLRLEGGKLVVEGGRCDARPGTQLPTQNKYDTKATIVDYGKCGSIKSIKNIPTEGYEKSVACEEGHGYIIKAEGASNINAYNLPIHDPADLYIRVYVEEPTAGGYKIYYQYPFVVE